MNVQYSKFLNKLYNINIANPVKLGLENINALYNLHGKPTHDIPIVHIAGTNGKGSVALKVAEVLRLSGLTTGIASSIFDSLRQ